MLRSARPADAVAAAERLLSRTALAAGLRAGTATVLPIALAWAAGSPALLLAALGGWLASMADVGGAYRRRARVMAAYTVGASATWLIGTQAGAHPLVALVLLFAWAVGGGLLRALGESGATLGTLLAVTMGVALDAGAHPRPGQPPAALGALALAAGGAWAMLLALVVWPVRPWAPARRAAAACWTRMAGYARALGEAAGASGAAAADALQGVPRTWHPQVRQAIEDARVAAVATRRRRLAGSRRADDVLLLLDQADEVFSTLVATTDELEAVLAAGALAPAQRTALAGALTSFADALEGVARAIPSGREAGVRPAALAALDDAVMALWVTLEPSPVLAGAAALADAAAAEDGPAPQAGQLAAVLELGASQVAQAAETARSLAGRPSTPRAGLPRLRRLRTEEMPIAERRRGRLRLIVSALRDALDPGSTVARHALRLGAAVVAAQLVAQALHVRRGIWVTTTVIIVLQPWAGLTARRGRERLAGTVLGGVVAALLAAVLRDRLQMAAAMFPLAVLAVALRPVHYGLFTFFLTPVFVLLAEPAVGDWRLAAVRIGDTMLGGLLAVVASRLLWPKWEHRAIAPVLGDAVEATRAWVRTAAHAALAGNATEPAVAEALARARRRAGLASNAADAAVERLLAEPRGRWRDEEALLALLARVRRVNGAATGLAVGRAARAPSASAASAVDAALAEVTRALHAEQPPDDGVAEALRHAVPRDGLPDGPTRLVRHVAGLHATASRLLRPTP